MPFTPAPELGKWQFGASGETPACNNPAACTYIDTTGFLNATYGIDGMSLHPSGPNNLGRIAPQVATLLKPMLCPAGGGAMADFNAIWQIAGRKVGGVPGTSNVVAIQLTARFRVWRVAVALHCM